MILYKEKSSDFIKACRDNSIASKLSLEYFYSFGNKPSSTEARSWEKSLLEVALVLDANRLYDNGILLEYQLPLSSMRIDCMITGNDILGHPNAVIVELKQWSQDNCISSILENEVQVRYEDGYKDVLHPSVQAGQYHMYLQDINSGLYNDDNIRLSACAYLHNYCKIDDDPLKNNKFMAIIEQYPLYYKDMGQEFSSYLYDRLSKGNGMQLLDKISNAQMHINKKLMDHVSNVINNRKEYILLGNQQIAYDKIMASISIAYKRQKRQAIIIKGGPGTGKSVIAINVMAELLKRGIETHYATGSAAFTETLRKVLGTRSSVMLKYFNSYTNAKCGSVPIIICDEAHRIRYSSANRFTKKDMTRDWPQIKELLWSGKVCVFFIDDKQVVRPNEIGSSQYIREFAKKYKFDIQEIELTTQFKCSGSVNYLNWIDSILDLGEVVKKKIWHHNKEIFDFRIMDSPEDIENTLRQRLSDGYSARMMAGFCWEWSKELDMLGKLKNDVVINDYKRPWNAPSQMRNLPSGVPKSNLWAYEPEGFNQIGCIYTAQGFEFDYAGVIFGKDLRYDIDKQMWIGDKEKSYDWIVKHSKDNFINLVKNTYRVLLSRGMKGCYIYFQDEDTREYVESLIE